jgi:hypothetical protein
MEQGDRGEARQEADDAGDRNQAPVMLRRQAVENPKQPHLSSGCVQSAYWLVNIVIRFLIEHSRALRVPHLARPVDWADRFSESAIATRCPAQTRDSRAAAGWRLAIADRRSSMNCALSSA